MFVISSEVLKPSLNLSSTLSLKIHRYYEWQKKGKSKIPHFTRFKDGSLMLLAGLYDVAHLESPSSPTRTSHSRTSHTDSHTDPTIEPLWTFTIVTTDACKSFTWLHDRQPVILSTREALERWLDCESGTWDKELSRLCLPYREAGSKELEW